MRQASGDRNYGCAYEKPDAQMLKIWRVAVLETREVIRTM